MIRNILLYLLSPTFCLYLNSRNEGNCRPFAVSGQPGWKSEVLQKIADPGFNRLCVVL